MKTCPLFYAFLVLFAIGCSKSEEPSDEDGKTEQEVDAAYTLLLKDNGQLTGALLEADAETLSVNDADSGFDEIAEPQLISEDGKVLTMYHKKSDCSGTVIVHDFESDTAKSFDVFTDLDACTLTAHAVVNGGNTVYAAYTLEQDSKADAYFIRAMNISGGESTFVDIALEFKPVDLVFAKDRLFVLALDEHITGEHKLTIVDPGTNRILFTEKLGLDALGFFKDPEENIIVGYEELHTTYDSQTLDFNHTNYPPDAQPNLTGATFRDFDSSGKMYYARIAGAHSEYERIPAVYDFDTNSSVLYAYENFLTEAQREFEFEIENTTVVQYDEANNLLLVGYKKSGESNKGGLLRIKPIPKPKFAGNLDLDGVPYSIYID
jgi:hypothetical protein